MHSFLTNVHRYLVATEKEELDNFSMFYEYYTLHNVISSLVISHGFKMVNTFLLNVIIFYDIFDSLFYIIVSNYESICRILSTGKLAWH